MNIDQFISGYLPYLIGIRAVEGYKILDIQIPSSWKFGTAVAQGQKNNKKVQILVAGNDKSNIIISLIGDEQYQNFDTLFKHFDTIIKVNREREEKNRLFREKVKQLEDIFVNSDLDVLTNLSFEIKETQNDEIDNDTFKLPDSDDPNLVDTTEDDDSEVLDSLNQKMAKLSKIGSNSVLPTPQGQQRKEPTLEEVLQQERIDEANEPDELDD